MAGFTQTFGASPVSPSEVAYAAYVADGSYYPFNLVWPQFSEGNTYVAARFMSLSSATGAFDTFYMPDATLISVGYDAIIFNPGSFTIQVAGFNGLFIASLNPGDVYYLMLSGNTTQDGTWISFMFGTGTSAANASALAGAGLLAAAGVLNVNLTSVMVSTSYTLTAAARDVLQVWTGGSGTITLPLASGVGNGFLFPLANNGSGSVTVATSGGDTIDGASTSVFAQTQSGFVLSTGTSWVTVGKGIQNTFAVTLLNLNVAGSSNVTETSAQAQNIIQQFTGVLTGNISVIVPNTVQLYFCYNETTGPYTLTLTTAAGTGVTIAQGSHAILYCDGVNVVNAFTATITSNLTIPVGSASSPSLNVTGSLTTGFFSGAANTISTAAGGNEVVRFSSVASAVNYITETSAAAGNDPLISVAGTDTNITLVIEGKGTGTVAIPAITVTGGTLDGAVIGGVTPAAITGTTIAANTGFTGPLTGNVIGNVTGNLSGNVTGNVTGTVTGHSTLDLAAANNLSDVANAGTARGNLSAAKSGVNSDITALLGFPNSELTETGGNLFEIANNLGLQVNNIAGSALAPIYCAAATAITGALVGSQFAATLSASGAAYFTVDVSGTLTKLYIQWNTGSSTGTIGTGSNASVTVNWPESFPTACIFALAGNASGSANLLGGATIISKSATQVVVNFGNPSAAGYAATPVVIGIGY